MDYKKVFYEKYVLAHARNMYGEQSLEKVEREFPAWKNFFGRFLPNDANARILDLGCGDGGFVYFLRSLGFTSVEGVDASEEQVKEARRLGISGTLLGDALAFLRTRNSSYDLIFARDLIEHLTKEEITVLVPAVFESLRSGGMFVVQTPNAESLLGARLRYADFTHEVAFTQSSIRQLLGAFGFVDIKAYPMRPVVRGPVSFMRYCAWRVIELFLRLYLIAATGYRKGIYTQDILCVAKK